MLALGHLRETFHIFHTSLVYLCMYQKPVCTGRKQCRHSSCVHGAKRNISFFQKKIENIHIPLKGSPSGSNVCISEKKRTHQNSFKYCGDIPLSDFSKHSINWPLVIILDIVNIQPMVTGRQIRHHRTAKWLACSVMNWWLCTVQSKNLHCSFREKFKYICNWSRPCFICALALYIIWKLDSEKEKKVWSTSSLVWYR